MNPAAQPSAAPDLAAPATSPQTANLPVVDAAASATVPVLTEPTPTAAVAAHKLAAETLATKAAPTAAKPVLPPLRPARATALIVSLGVVVMVLIVISAGIGQMHFSPGEVLHVLGAKLGLTIGSEPAQPNAEAVLLNIRLPRVMLAAIAGAGLATAGAVMQGVFGNPLAEPGLVGVSSGAAAAACGGIALGVGTAGPWATAGLAFAGGLATTALVYMLSRSGGRTEVVTLVLTGIAVNAIAGAAIALFTFLADTSAREEIIFWQMGSLNGTRWVYVWVAAPLVVIGVVGALTLAKRLDLLSLGERGARHLGVDVERLRIVAIVLVALMTAAAVAFCGIIAFVGLVVPHLIRMVMGPGHRVLLPASALGGAALLTAADLVARNAVSYADLPIGMLTALVGGPFFFYLLRRTRRQAGGWC
jgi:iron complex transport system permease protein